MFEVCASRPLSESPCTTYRYTYAPANYRYLSGPPRYTPYPNLSLSSPILTYTDVW